MLHCYLRYGVEVAMFDVSGALAFPTTRLDASILPLSVSFVVDRNEFVLRKEF
jgi:hypothetical protein